MGYAYTIEESFQTNAKVVFLGACEVGSVLEALWSIKPNTKGQALIAPDYSQFTGAVFLGDAAAVWQIMAQALVQGQTVQGAVAAGNSYSTTHNFVERWTFIGNGSVTITPP